MLFRALFWISLVAILMPHEPDLGFGRPGTGVALKDLQLPASLANPSQVCDGREQACGKVLGVVDWFQANALKSLAAVKAEIEEQQRARQHG